MTTRPHGLCLLLLLSISAACQAPSSRPSATATDASAGAAVEPARAVEASARKTSASSDRVDGAPLDFVTYELDGRLWVFADGSQALHEFQTTGEPAKSITLVGMGPGGKTLRGPSKDLLLSYIYQRPGYHIEARDERLWVFAQDSDGYREFLEHGEPAKCVTLIGSGPDGRTLRGDERDVLKRYCFERPGFFVDYADERLLVFRTGSEGQAQYLASGEPAKSVTLVGVGPGGQTIRSDDKALIYEYLGSQPGFHLAARPFGDGYILWVLREGSEALAEFLDSGEPARSVTRLGVGPAGLTIRSDSAETIDAYLAAR